MIALGAGCIIVWLRRDASDRQSRIAGISPSVLTLRVSLPFGSTQVQRLLDHATRAEAERLELSTGLTATG